MSNFLIDARNVSKSFRLLPVLHGVTFGVNQGETAIITGHNGSGKSTLVRILAGLSSASSGGVFLFDEPARKLRACNRRRIGLVTHQSFLYSGLTARENLNFFAQLYGRENPLLDADRAVTRVGLGSVADERVDTFSRGMEQRLTLARATIADPDVLLMDEPFTALDGEGVRLVLDLIEEAMNRGGAVVITAHETLRLGGLTFTGYGLVRGRLYATAAGAETNLGHERSAAAD